MATNPQQSEPWTADSSFTADTTGFSADGTDLTNGGAIYTTPTPKGNTTFQPAYTVSDINRFY